MSDLVLHVPWGGLGDHLQFSTLPEIYSRAGYRVFVSSRNQYRNREIYDLVWGANPYVLGESDAEPNIGAVAPCQRWTDSIVSDWEVGHRLGIQNHYPKIYYKPNILPELRGFTIIDLTSVSDTYDPEVLHRAVREYIPKDKVSQACFQQDIVDKDYCLTFEANGGLGIHPWFVKDIFHYCDIIASCSELVTCMSGAAVLAASMKPLPKVTVFMAQDKPIFKFKGIDYRGLPQTS